MEFKATPKTDQTAALQAALNANGRVVINDRYIINDSLIVPSGGSLTGTGALIASDQPKGLLKSRGIYINLSGKEKVAINGITFQPSLGMAISGWATACILLQNSVNCFVENNIFDFSFAYGKGMDAVWVGASKYATIRGNICRTVGITYAENGSSYGLCERNQIYNANGNALGGIGNNKDVPNVGNTVRKNYVQDAGRMGIEDQQNSTGTVIKNNTIKGSGKANPEGIAISAVGMSTLVEKNYAIDFLNYGIELAGKCNNRAVKNIIYDNGSNTGVIANFTTAKPTDIFDYDTIIDNNTITGAKVGVSTFGDGADQEVQIKNNSLIDFIKTGIQLDVQSSIKSKLFLIGNSFILNDGKATRYGITAYSELLNGKQGCSYSIQDNIFCYNGKNESPDCCVLLNTDNVDLMYNTLIGYSSKAYGFTSNGTKPAALVDVGNKW